MQAHPEHPFRISEGQKEPGDTFAGVACFAAENARAGVMSNPGCPPATGTGSSWPCPVGRGAPASRMRRQRPPIRPAFPETPLSPSAPVFTRRDAERTCSHKGPSRTEKIRDEKGREAAAINPSFDFASGPRAVKSVGFRRGKPQFLCRAARFTGPRLCRQMSKNQKKGSLRKGGGRGRNDDRKGSQSHQRPD